MYYNKQSKKILDKVTSWSNFKTHTGCSDVISSHRKMPPQVCDPFTLVAGVSDDGNRDAPSRLFLLLIFAHLSFCFFSSTFKVGCLVIIYGPSQATRNYWTEQNTNKWAELMNPCSSSARTTASPAQREAFSAALVSGRLAQDGWPHHEKHNSYRTAELFARGRQVLVRYIIKFSTRGKCYKGGSDNFRFQKLKHLIFWNTAAVYKGKRVPFFITLKCTLAHF